MDSENDIFLVCTDGVTELQTRKTFYANCYFIENNIKRKFFVFKLDDENFANNCFDVIKEYISIKPNGTLELDFYQKYSKTISCEDYSKTSQLFYYKLFTTTNDLSFYVKNNFHSQHYNYK